jgi:hypothetical protein
MKNKFKITILLFVLILQFSCTKEENSVPSDGIPYYKFTQDERNKLISEINVNNEIIYKNQDNTLLKFKIYYSKIEKHSETSNGIFLGYVTTYFHYDEQTVAMSVEGTSLNSIITILKYPVGSDYATQYPIVGTPKFYGYFTFPLWNGYYENDTYNKYISIDFNIPTTTMTFNGKTYNKVLVLNSDKTEILEPTNVYPLNVNVIYYDYNFGIIGFDDLNGKSWRIQ